jgi:hypothetical protein
MSSIQNNLYASDIVAGIKSKPSGFMMPLLEKTRTAKNGNKYADNYMILANGQKKRLGFAWKMTPLTGGVKSPEDRKYGASIQFRESSGDLGYATTAIYKEFRRLIEEAKANGIINVKNSKAIIRSIVQTDLESGEKLDDPIIRFGLPFNKDGKPLFNLLKIVKDKKGKPKSVPVKCTVEDVHTLIRNNMVTSGYVTMDSVVFSSFGISLPARVKTLVIKSEATGGPAASTILSKEEMMAMIGDDDDDDNNDNDNDDDDEDDEDDENENEDENEDENENDTPPVDNQLEELRKLALVDGAN